MTTSMERFGAQVRRQRGEMSLREVASQVGISAPYLHDIEHGRRSPSAETMLKLAKALGVPDQAPLWDALCGRMPADIERLVLASPDRWDELRAMLKRPKTVRAK